MIRDTLRLLEMLRHERQSADALAALQLRRLRRLVRHAYDHVDHYRALFDSVGATPDDVRSLDDLRRLPITTKADFRAAGRVARTARDVDPSRCIDVVTSGTTGEPMSILLTGEEGRNRRLDGFRAFRALGYRPRDRLVRLGNDRHSHPVLLRHRLGIFRSETVSGLLSVDEQIRALADAHPTFLVGFPSSLHAVIDKLAGRLSRVARPRLIVTGAESCDEPLRARVREDLGIPIHDFYGSVETGPLASDCLAREGLHVHADRILVECDDSAPATADGLRPLLVTVLDSYATPILRYRLGDLVELTTRRCSCGSAFPLMRPPAGRDCALVRCPDGSIVSPFALTFPLEKLPGVRRYRVIQDATDHLVIQLVVDDRDRLPAALVRETVRGALGDVMGSDVEYVEALAPSEGKFQVFTSTLPSTAATP